MIALKLLYLRACVCVCLYLYEVVVQSLVLAVSWAPSLVTDPLDTSCLTKDWRQLSSFVYPFLSSNMFSFVHKLIHWILRAFIPRIVANYHFSFAFVFFPSIVQVLDKLCLKTGYKYRNTYDMFHFLEYRSVIYK